MGETAELRNPQAGTFSFNDFISQGDNEATIRNLLRTLIPVVDMRDFQRKYEFDAGGVTLQVGDRLLLVWTVPDNEWWRPRSLMFINKDNINHNVRVEFSVDNTGNKVYRASQTQVANGESQVVYGQTIDAGISADGSFTSILPNPLAPQDTMTMTMLANAAIISEQQWLMIYELVPQPAVALVRGVPAVATII